METIEDAVIREIEEELGIKIELAALLCVTNHILPEENTHYVAPTFLAKTKGDPKIMEPEKILAVKWGHLYKLPSPLSKTTIVALNSYLNDNSSRSWRGW